MIATMQQGSEGFIVESPKIPELFSAGETIDQAIKRSRMALAGCIELYTENGWQVPETYVKGQGVERADER